MALLLSHSIYRDLILERQLAGDLRNRVVGARMIHDGKLPYGYIWHAGDGIRYFDGNNWNPESTTSNITASPFFHQMFIPLFELPERTVSIIWLLLQYLFLAGLMIMICALAKDNKLKWLIINVSILFTATEAWKDLIACGQLYFFEGFLMVLVIYGLLKNKKNTILFAGIVAAIFVLTRPIGIALFIPFIFYLNKYLRFLITAFIFLAVYGLFVLTSPYQKALYQDYVFHMGKHVEMHQNEDPNAVLKRDERISPYSNIEGIDMDEVHRLNKEHPIKVYSESASLFVVYYKITHSKLPLAVLNGCSALTILLLSGLFYYHTRRDPVNDLQVVLFGFLLYMIIELFNPIHRHQYNTVQWFPLVLSSFLLLRDWKNLPFLLLILGLLLNITNLHWLLMRHLLGEFCWLAAILILVFSSRYNYLSWKKQS